MRRTIVPDAGTPPRIAFQGEPGAFGESAVARWSRGAATAVPAESFAGVVAAVSGGAVELGVLPLENSIAGIVEEADRALRASAGVVVVGEVEVAVRQCLLALPGVELAELLTAESHPVALAQCGAFLRAHPRLRAVPVADTAGAARAVAAAGDRTRGAIAGRDAAALYGLSVLCSDVHDPVENVTRFAVIAPARDLRGHPHRNERSPT